VRTVSASGAVGSVCDGFWKCVGHDNTPPRHPVNGPWLDGTHSACRGSSAYATFGKPSDFTVISSSMVFMMADENPNSINDGALGTVAALNNLKYVDWPASLHDGACTLAFCDGHAEVHKWLGSILQGPFRSVPVVPTDPGNMADLVWLATHSSSLK
jgi:prepilin-type processing-associated H-X9-DG protein